MKQMMGTGQWLAMQSATSCNSYTIHFFNAPPQLKYYSYYHSNRFTKTLSLPNQVNKYIKEGKIDEIYKLGQYYNNSSRIPRNIEKAINLYEIAAAHGNVNAIYALAKIYKDEKKFLKALELYEKAATKGHAGAMYSLGRAYSYKYTDFLRVKKNSVKAVELYEKAAIKGHADAIRSLEEESIYEWFGFKKNYKKLISLYEKIIQEDNTVSVNGKSWIKKNLMIMYGIGIGVSQNYKKALEFAERKDPGVLYYTLAKIYYYGNRKFNLKVNKKKGIDFFTQASGLGNVNAIYELAKTYENEKKFSKALELYEKAATKGHAGAMYSLGRAYSYKYTDFLRVKKNSVKAVELYEKAAIKGHADAIRSLEEESIYEWFGFKKNYKKLISLYEKIIQEDNTVSVNGKSWIKKNLMIMYGIGIGVSQNYKKALEFAERKDPGVLYYTLAKIYYYGNRKFNLKVNKKKGIDFFTQASGLGNVNAIYELAEIYENEKKFLKAVELYEKAADKGMCSALYALGRLYKYGNGVRKDENIAIKFYIKGIQIDPYFREGKEEVLWNLFITTRDLLLSRIRKNESSLLSLDLKNWKIVTDGDIYDLCQSLKENTFIKTLDLRGNQISRNGLYYIINLLIDNKTIEQVKLDDNPFLDNDEKSQRIIKSVLIPLLQHRRGEEIACETVDLHECRTKMIQNVLFTTLPYYTKLLSLNLSHLGEGYEFFFPFIANILNANPAIEEIDLSYNDLDLTALYSLSGAMRLNNTLKSINLANNRIMISKEHQIKTIVNNIRKNKNLNHVNLSANFLRPIFDSHLSNNPAALFYSQKENTFIQSILKPSITLSSKLGKEKFVAALACNKNSEHASIIIEGIGNTGQRFMKRYHINIHKEYWLRTITKIDEFNSSKFNRDNWYMDSYEIDYDKYCQLRDDVKNEIDNEITHPFGWIPTCTATCHTAKSEKQETVNCTKWCIRKMQNAKIKIKTRIIPSWAAQMGEEEKPTKLGWLWNKTKRSMGITSSKVTNITSPNPKN